jgi:hypothetical protein
MGMCLRIVCCFRVLGVWDLAFRLFRTRSGKTSPETRKNFHYVGWWLGRHDCRKTGVLYKTGLLQWFKTWLNDIYFKLVFKGTVKWWSPYRVGFALFTSHEGPTLFLDLGTRRGWGVSVTPRPLSTPEKDPVHIVQEAGWPQGRSGQVRKVSPPPGFDPGTVKSVASREVHID